MQRGRLLFRLILLFAAVLIGYVLVFGWIERRRVVNGPWTVTFTAEAGHLRLTVNQAALGVSNVVITFPDAVALSNELSRIEFTKARNAPYAVPFGECIFQDLLFLPGTVTLKMFDHEIQFMPRTLTLDKVESPWRSGETIELRGLRTNSPSLPQAPSGSQLK